MFTPFLLLTCTEGGIKGGLYVICTESKWLYLTHDTSWEGDGIQFSPHSIHLPDPLHPGSLPTWLPSQQTRSSSLIPTLLWGSPPPQANPPPPTHKPQLGFSTYQLEREQREREGDILISRISHFFFQAVLKSIFQLYEFSVWGPQLEATPNKLANPPQADAGWQVKKDYSKVNTMQSIYRELRWESLQHCQDTG